MIKKILLFCIISFLLSQFAYAATFSFAGSNDQLDIEEEMGDCLEAVTSSQLDDLKGGEIKTTQGSTKYSQYIRFKDSTTAINSSRVMLTKTGGSVGEFLKVNKGTSVTDAFFEYHIQFESGLKSKSSSGDLTNLVGKKFNILNNEFLIVDGKVDGKNIELKLSSGSIFDSLKKGEKKEYTIGNKKFEVSITNLETATKSAILNVNGKDLTKLKKAETESLDSDTILGITNVLTSSEGDLVQFFMGANLIEFVDNSYEDDSFYKGVSINKQKIEDAFVKISASLVNDVLKITDIKYRLIIKNSIYVSEGGGVLEALTYPQAMLANWDIKYDGLAKDSVSEIKLIPPGSDDEYTLSFRNLEDHQISVPFVSNKGTFKFGDVDQDLIIVEGAAVNDFNVDLEDYFVLTTSNSKTGKTYILKYDSIDKGTNTLHFDQLGASSKSVQYVNSSQTNVLGEASLPIGSITYKIYINNVTGNNSLAVDLNGDGNINGAAVDIIVKGGGIIDPGASNTIAGNTHAITLTTDSSQFEEGGGDEQITITIDTTKGTPIGIQTTFTGLNTETSSTAVSGLSHYGARFDLKDLTGAAESLNIKYPSKQAFAKVSITVGAGYGVNSTVKDIKVSTCSNGKQDGDETGIDCGGSCPACPTCADGKRNQGEEGIDCGGPCPDKCKVEQKIKKSFCEEGCVQILEGGKSKCLKTGQVVEKYYCDVDHALKAQKKNGLECKENYECKSMTCIEEKCGKKISPLQLIVTSMIVIVIIGIIFYAFSLFK